MEAVAVPGRPVGAAILDSLHAALTRYVILPTPAAVDAVVLWIAASHAQPAWAHTPRLVIRGPEKRCGKSRLLDIVEAACHDPFITVNSSPAAVYRSISDDPPTMLVDEADTIFGPAAGGNEDLRGLLNAGHQRNRPAKRYDANTSTVESIPTFAMAALAGIGAMPDTIEDRAADTWEPLVAVADHAGGTWPDRARAAVLALTQEASSNDKGSIGSACWPTAGPRSPATPPYQRRIYSPNSTTTPKHPGRNTHTAD